MADRANERLKVVEMMKKREKVKEEFEKKKSEIETEYSRKIKSLNSKFDGGTNDVFEERFRNQTVGLVSSKDFKKRREHLDLLNAEEEAHDARHKREQEISRRKEKEAEK